MLDINMKICLVLATLVAATLAEAPLIPSLPASASASAPEGFRPSGRLLLLPARQEEPTPQPQAAPIQEEKAAVLDSGEYYVLLPDGRLQMVKYTTLPLTESAEVSQKVKEAGKPAYQLNYVQYPLPGSQQFTQSRLELVPVPAPEKQVKPEEESGFQAQVTYRDVKPISAPIYAFNPAPLVRVLRK